MIKKTSFIILFIALSINMFAQEEKFEKLIYIKDTKSLPYRLFVPANVTKKYDYKDGVKINLLHSKNDIKKYPLILFLHGAGERGSNNETQLTHIADVFADDKFQEDYPCFVLAPQCPNELKWVEVSWSLDSHIQPESPSYSMDLTMQIIEQLIDSYPIDENRLYVTGLSMGGYGAWDIISRYPQKFAAAVPVCGGGDENTAFAISKTPIWAFHGTKDRAVKVSRSRNMINAIRDIGANPKYTEYPNLGHLCWDEAYATKELYVWLFAQKLKN